MPPHAPLKKKRRSSVVSGVLICLILIIWTNIALINVRISSLQAQHEAISASDTPADKANANENVHRLAGLSCARYGGPLSEESVNEMVYWKDIPSDATFVSPFAAKSTKDDPKYLVFQPDRGGFNNIRMSMETATVMALAMGRILVMPPTQKMYLLDKEHQSSTKKNKHSFTDFYHFDTIAHEHVGLTIIPFEEFMKREAVTGHLIDSNTRRVSFPPDNRTNWDGDQRAHYEPIWPWLRTVTMNPLNWSYKTCVAAFPKNPGPEGVRRIEGYFEKAKGGSVKDYTGKPIPIDASPVERLRELVTERSGEICTYDEEKSDARVFYLNGDSHSGTRLLTHFYTYLYFEDYHQDLWTKRFVRDHLRYVDEIQCAAARIVEALREKAVEHGDKSGSFDTFHVRRGDFQYSDITKLSAKEIYKSVKDVLAGKGIIFIATDEKDQSFFDYFRKKGHPVYFLSDFFHLIPDVSKNFYGHLDQLVASRGRVFVGAYRSTFTSYINRIRGYHAQNAKAPGWEDGLMESYYYTPEDRKNDMRIYKTVKSPVWSREFPMGWRQIDFDVEGSQVARS